MGQKEPDAFCHGQKMQKCTSNAEDAKGRMGVSFIVGECQIAGGNSGERVNSHHAALGSRSFRKKAT